MKYHVWDITLEDSGTQIKTEFLERMFGGAIQAFRTAKKGEVRLPLYQVQDDVLLTVQGFGSQATRKMRGRLDVPVIMGSCLWDGRWCVTTDQGKYKLGLHEERNALAEDMSSVRSVQIPSSLGQYHWNLIHFQKCVVEGLQNHGGGREIEYLIPGLAYEQYIDRLPLGEEIKAILKIRLREFIVELLSQVSKALGAVRFFDPLLDDPEGVSRIREILELPMDVCSFVYPYAGMHSEVVGVEDLVESGLFQLGRKAARGLGLSRPEVTSFMGVLGIPTPYIHPSSSDAVQIVEHREKVQP